MYSKKICIKTYYKAIVIKKVWYTGLRIDILLNEIELRVQKYTHVSLVSYFQQGCQDYTVGERKVFSTNSAGTTRYPHAKE